MSNWNNYEYWEGDNSGDNYQRHETLSRELMNMDAEDEYFLEEDELELDTDDDDCPDQDVELEFEDKPLFLGRKRHGNEDL
jgi:hypothetical protein|tara:strand:- start:515 stop:757 length:243 start_codon:yes stop_codon:yes gene_type:complete